MQKITSVNNEKVKLVRSLEDKKARLADSLFVVEGVNIVGDMPAEAVKELYIKESKLSELMPISQKLGKEPTVVQDNAFDKMSHTVTCAGIIALARIPEPKPVTGNLVVVMDGVSDAGNVGTIIRTACAMGVRDIIAVGTADAYAPKVVRSTMGGIFHTNIVPLSYAGAREALKNYNVVALDMGGSNVFDYVPEGKTAIVVGSEAHGVSKEFREIADTILAIPMYGGKMESLNAGVSASIALATVTNKLGGKIN